MTTKEDNRKYGRNQTQPIQRIFQITFNLLYTFLTKRSSKSYQKDENGIMKST